MIRKILRITETIVLFLLAIAVLFAAVGTIQKPTWLNIFILIFMVVMFILIVFVFLSSKKEKRLSDKKAEQDRIHQEEFFGKLEKRFGKEIADQLR